jgi:phosphate transport system permease protein
LNDKLSNEYKLTDKRHRPLDVMLYLLIWLFSLGIILLVIYFIVYILYKGLPIINISFLTTAPNPIKQTVGILPSIINTVIIIACALIISFPLGVGSAIYINEYAKNKRFIRIIEFTTEILSGIPSILFGVFGYIFFCTLLNLKVSLIAGALTLTIMVLPIMVRTTQEALKSVPQSYREGALGIGATKWHMIRTILLPSASGGILTGVTLSIGRMMGESAALILVAGGSAMYMPKGNIFEQLASSGSTLSVELFRYGYSRGDNDIAFGIAAVLLIIVIFLNILTNSLTKRLEQK